MSKKYSIVLEQSPRSAELEILYQGIHDYNTKYSGGAEAQTLVIFLRDASGEIAGGVSGWTAYGWLRIDVLWVTENLRGQGFGKQLLEAAEAEGVRRGCQFATLDSFNFQAAAMYKKFGYADFAKLDLFVENQTWHFMTKKLAAKIERE